MRSTACAVLLLMAAPLWGQTVELPPEVKGDVGAFVRVEAKTDCASLQWYAVDAGLNLFPVDLLKATTTAVVVAPRPGRYRLLAYGGKDGRVSAPAVTTVVVGDAPPGPGPLPPGPGPTPPDDPLYGKLQAAYAADASPTKAADTRQLAALYRQGAEVASRADLATWGALYDVMRDAARTLGVAGKLGAVQAALGAELSVKLPTARDKPLDPAGREAAAAQFRRVAALLEALK